MWSSASLEDALVDVALRQLKIWPLLLEEVLFPGNNCRASG